MNLIQRILRSVVAPEVDAQWEHRPLPGGGVEIVPVTLDAQKLGGRQRQRPRVRGQEYYTQSDSQS